MVTSYTAVDHTLFPPSTVDWSNGQLSESHPLLFYHFLSRGYVKRTKWDRISLAHDLF